jgi:probable HAF family extracellular repeat protein
MKSILIGIITGNLLATLAAGQTASYRVIDLGALQDGPFSIAVGASSAEIVSGASGLPDGSQRAVLWYRGTIIDLARAGLGGRNSGAFGVNAVGMASGLAETSRPDPRGEDFCGFGTFLTCLPFLSYGGGMVPLPTLGGSNGEAGLINNRGDVAGNTENTITDLTCPAGGPQRLQEKPVIWRNAKVKELPTFPGDPDGWAFGINDNGQVVGASGICSPLNPQTGVYILSRHALLWDAEELIDLGNLGGTGAFGPGNIGGEINAQGEVVGTSDLTGDTTFHAFRWTRRGGIQDLGTLGGDFASAGLGIGDSGEIVGASFDAEFNPRAFLWRNGVMTDLNTLIPENSPFISLFFAHGINSRREIAGFGLTNAGEVHGFLAVPTDHDSHAENARSEILRGSGGAVPSEIARKLLFRLLRTPGWETGSGHKP